MAAGPQINAAGLDGSGIQRFVEDKVDGRKHGNSDRRRGRGHLRHERILLIQSDPTQIQGLAVANHARREARDAANLDRHGFQLERACGNAIKSEGTCAVRPREGSPWQSTLRSKSQQDIDTGDRVGPDASHQAAHHRTARTQGQRDAVGLAVGRYEPISGSSQRLSLGGQTVGSDRDVVEFVAAVGIGQGGFRARRQRRLNCQRDLGVWGGR